MTDSRLRGVRVAMLLTNPYRPDVRVQKEAFALAAAGAEVVVFAWDRSGRLPTIERPYEGVTIRRLFIRSRDGLGIRQFPRFLRYWRAAARAVGAERWDVLHAHDLDGLVGAVLSNRGNARLVYEPGRCGEYSGSRRRSPSRTLQRPRSDQRRPNPGQLYDGNTVFRVTLGS